MIMTIQSSMVPWNAQVRWLTWVIGYSGSVENSLFPTKGEDALLGGLGYGTVQYVLYCSPLYWRW